MQMHLLQWQTVLELLSPAKQLLMFTEHFDASGETGLPKTTLQRHGVNICAYIYIYENTSRTLNRKKALLKHVFI